MRRRYTIEEDNKILDKVGTNYYNLQKAFRELAIEMNRNPASVSNRWYHVLSRNNTSPIFMTYGKTVSTENRKNITAKNTEFLSAHPLSFWRRLLNIFH